MDYNKRKLLKFDENEIVKEDIDEDDFGYEIDESGMIPKLEELKAAGKEEIEEDDDFESKYNLNALDNLDNEDVSEDELTASWKKANDFESIRNLKIDYYDEEDGSILKELKRIADALEKIAEKL